jgi:hypothetical protein
MAHRLLNAELERMWKETVEVPPHHLPRGTEESRQGLQCRPKFELSSSETQVSIVTV